MNAAIFLDRDGVIIENRADYVRTWADVAYLPGALEALRRVSALDYRIVIVTNQAGIGHGLIEPAEAERINQRIVADVRAAGGRIDGVYVCPHTPADNCPCRKPAPGLLLAAGRDLGLDMGRSLLIGDALSDLEAGRRAGVGRTALVRTGRGAEQEALAIAGGLGPGEVYDDLAAALASFDLRGFLQPRRSH